MKKLTIIDCPRCGKEICLSLEMEDDLVFIHQEEEKSCDNCKYSELLLQQDPCLDCEDYYSWERK